MEDHKSSRVDLLNLICERFPSNAGSEVVSLTTCSSNQARSVSPLGFLLLEQIEAAFGSTEQRIEKIHIDEPICGNLMLETHWLPSLSSRASRQQEMVKLVEIGEIDISYAYGSETWIALQQQGNPQVGNPDVHRGCLTWPNPNFLKPKPQLYKTVILLGFCPNMAGVPQSQPKNYQK